MDRNSNLYKAYVEILRRELVPAMGCTEPIAVAYCAAKARAVLGKKPDEITRWRLTPQNWEKLLNNTKEMLLQIPENAMAKNMIMLDNWNEWCEGHYIAPHAKGGFEYLDAVRRALTKCDNTPDHVSPLENGYGPYGENIDLSLTQDWVPYILNKMN